MSWHPYVVDVLCKLVCCPFLFAILASEAEFLDGVAVIGSILSVNYRIVAVYPHCPIIMQD